MKKLCAFFLLICFFCTLQTQTPRNLIVTLDWANERITKELDNINLKPEDIGQSFGPVTGDLVTALTQKAAPIITTSTLWHNFVARRKLFQDFLEGQVSTYKNKYKRFDDVTIKKFQEVIQSYFQPDGKKMEGTPIEKEIRGYFVCYAIPFQENDWIIKKISDYIYLLIPKEYLEKLKASKELEKSEELKKTFEELKKTFSDDDLILGLKITAMSTISYQDALNPDKHKLTIDKNNYAQLLAQKDMDIIVELSKKYASAPPPESFVISKHFINVLKDIFITERDLTINKDSEKTDLYRALYLHKWHIYLSGHGEKSDPGTLQDIDLSKVDPHTYIEFVYNKLAGLDLFAFRTWLAFLQSNIKTEFLFYSTCYSGGQHLQKLFEHEWEYSTGTKLQKEAKPDIFNYMIVAANLEYTAIDITKPYIFPTPYKKIPRDKLGVTYNLQFPLFFKAIETYFSIGHVEMEDKKLYFETLKKIKENKAKFAAMVAGTLPVTDILITEKEIKDLQNKLGNLHFITLYGVINYVHNIEEYRPAVRYPGTDFFIPLPLDEQQQVTARIRFETSAQTQARKEEETRIKKLIEQQTKKHIEEQKKQPVVPKQPAKPTTPVYSENIIKALNILRQNLMQLTQSILK